MHLPESGQGTDKQSNRWRYDPVGTWLAAPAALDVIREKATRPLRVLHVSQPVDGGVARVVERLAIDQVGAGYEVSVASPTELLTGIKKRDPRVRTHSWEASRSPGLALVHEMRELRSIITQVEPNIIHLHSSKAGLAGRLIDNPYRVPVIFQPHAWSFQAGDSRLCVAAKQWERLAARRTALFLLVSQDEKKLAPFSWSKSRVIANGVDTDAFYPIDRQEARRQIGIPDRPTVACVGRVCAQKGQDRLLDCWPQILKEVPDAQLVMVGDGPELNRLRRSTDPSSVYWLGRQSALNLYYNAADVVALPSRWEAMALVPLEAMAAGRPVVAIDVGGARSTIGDAGVIVRSPNALAEAVSKLLADDSLTVDIGERARRRTMEHFRADDMSAQVRSMYGEFSG